MAAVALLIVAFVVGVALSLSSGINELVFDLPPSLYVALALLLVALLQTATAAVFAGIIWKEHHWSIGGRAFYSLATLFALAFLWVFNYLEFAPIPDRLAELACDGREPRYEPTN